MTRQGQKALQEKKTFKFYSLYGKTKREPSVLAVDETGTTIKEQEKVKNLNLYNRKRKGVKARSLDLVYPVRLTLLVEIADLNESPSQFLLQSVKEVSQYVQIDYMLTRDS
ncbi:IS4 transposase [Sulfurisphaera ohwakuensis]|uniref:IS4 transposase n=1 Tax=Sulfurisphaera ohwakuensis TaxID=69656 RepID=A0A7J9RWF4_SULOH|nr:IS4 transposase [Sulfurisphaera ohwakuensis]